MSDSSKTAEAQKLSVSGSEGTLTFDGGIQQAYLETTVECFVSFDETATTSSLRLVADTIPVRIDFHGGNVKTVHAITSGGSGSLYVLGVRN